MKRKKALVGFISAIFCTVLLLIVFGTLYLDGAFDFIDLRDVALFQSPDGAYCLHYQQIGDPGFPFGPTNVRLTVTDADNKKLNSVDTRIFNDGVNADEKNITSIVWTGDSVTVLLSASEMEPNEIVIPFNNQ